MNRSGLLRELAALIVSQVRSHPTRVAFDGVDAAGKTTLANDIRDQLASSGRQVIRASVDGFHNPKSIRRRDDSPEGYFRNSFNYTALTEVLLDPLGPNGSRRFRRAVFDFRTDSKIASEAETADANAILLIDGVFLLRSELRAHWDLSIFVEADFENTVARAELRDRELFGSTAAVRDRYESRYVPGQRIYLEQEQPKSFANIVFVNNDFDRPRIEWPSYRAPDADEREARRAGGLRR